MEENKAVACIQNVVTQLESEYMTTAKEKTLLLQALRDKELLGHCAGKGKLTPCTPNLMMSFIPQAGTVQLPIPVTKWLAVALRCFFCPQILKMFQVLQLWKLHKEGFFEGHSMYFFPKRTTSPSESIRKPTSSVSRDERPPRLAGWLEGIWSVTWLGTSDFPGALQWDEAAEPAQFTGWGNMRSRRHNEQPSPAILGTRWEFWWNCPVADVTFPKYRLTVDNQMIGHWFFDFFPFCQWQFQWLQWQDMKHVSGHGRRQFWPETQWCITGLVVGGWTGGGTLRHLLQASPMRPVCRQSRVLPLVLGLCNVDSVKPDEVGYCIGILLVATDPFFEIKGSQQL